MVQEVGKEGRKWVVYLATVRPDGAIDARARDRPAPLL
jgi:hypothetical protein